MTRITWRRELACIGGLLGLAVILGLSFHWSLVGAGLRGNLTAHLNQKRQERREAQFPGVGMIDLAQAHKIWQEKKALFVDARKAKEYQKLHVQGAVNVPLEMWLPDSDLMKSDRSRELVIYCSQETCDDSLKLGMRLQIAGFTRVMAFTGGFRAWHQAGYPADSGDK